MKGSGRTFPPPRRAFGHVSCRIWRFQGQKKKRQRVTAGPAPSKFFCFFGRSRRKTARKSRLPCRASHVRRHGFAPVSKMRSFFQVQFPASASPERLLDLLKLIHIHRLQDGPVNQVLRRIPQDSSGFSNQVQAVFGRQVKPDADRNHLVKRIIVFFRAAQAFNR